MVDSVLQYQTCDGDRWDLIAHKYYGDATMLDRLIAANPHLPLAEQFTANLTVLIPIIQSDTHTAQEDMPPWMR
ncbi:tail protein X [Snodgrassella alvi]|uniref:Phage tail protein n=1 Tax=Snodgrassella alvi TaxID=1196083 RepID=A0A855G044_9NEIS|nr:tail protein X [Snodgrassella alvi]PIT59960.1 hypothetical protein BHC57_06745 [Snodgrassella alvi]